jgi:hypothetical protein
LLQQALSQATLATFAQGTRFGWKARRSLNWWAAQGASRWCATCSEEQRPPAKRKKKKFHIRLIQKWYMANFELVQLSLGAWFEFTRDLLAIMFSFNQLCHLSELTNTSPLS